MAYVSTLSGTDAEDHGRLRASTRDASLIHELLREIREENHDMEAFSADCNDHCANAVVRPPARLGIVRTHNQNCVTGLLAALQHSMDHADSYRSQPVLLEAPSTWNFQPDVNYTFGSAATRSSSSDSSSTRSSSPPPPPGTFRRGNPLHGFRGADRDVDDDVQLSDVLEELNLHDSSKKDDHDTQRDWALSKFRVPKSYFMRCAVKFSNTISQSSFFGLRVGTAPRRQVFGNAWALFLPVVKNGTIPKILNQTPRYK
ncbi:unnamed protein product [Cylicostephanus goldi]|uniref:Uncharacterized protein n=1 Tax=Cylicostephanus goldi TaxID=71465 RepID=A0A3P7LY49_CYLGO|nr:unnamed protein product [Cylicostephanus goldi]